MVRIWWILRSALRRAANVQFFRCLAPKLGRWGALWMLYVYELTVMKTTGFAEWQTVRPIGIPYASLLITPDTRNRRGIILTRKSSKLLYNANSPI